MTTEAQRRAHIARIITQAVNMALAGVGAPGRLHETNDGATYYADRILALFAPKEPS